MSAPANWRVIAFSRQAHHNRPGAYRGSDDRALHTALDAGSNDARLHGGMRTLPCLARLRQKPS